ncbi:hypothetical protein A6R68_13234, partial [Neotoma lepida]
VFSYTANKEIRTDDLCLDVSKLNGPVTMLKCHHLKGNQLWEYDPVTLRDYSGSLERCGNVESCETASVCVARQESSPEHIQIKGDKLLSQIVGLSPKKSPTNYNMSRQSRSKKRSEEKYIGRQYLQPSESPVKVLRYRVYSAQVSSTFTMMETNNQARDPRGPWKLDFPKHTSTELITPHSPPQTDGSHLLAQMCSSVSRQDTILVPSLPCVLTKSTLGPTTAAVLPGGRCANQSAAIPEKVLYLLMLPPPSPTCSLRRDFRTAFQPQRSLGAGSWLGTT